MDQIFCQCARGNAAKASTSGLAPDTFADDVSEMLYTDARMLSSSMLLEVVLSVERPAARGSRRIRAQARKARQTHSGGSLEFSERWSPRPSTVFADQQQEQVHNA